MRIVVALALLTALAAAFVTRAAMFVATFDLRVAPPFGVPADAWRRLVTLPNRLGGATLGVLEVLLFFGAFWLDAHVVVAAWRAFKVASKWEAWHNVIKVPDALSGIDAIDYAAARRAWGSLVFMRSLVGTITNLIMGVLGAEMARVALSA